MFKLPVAKLTAALLLLVPLAACQPPESPTTTNDATALPEAVSAPEQTIYTLAQFEALEDDATLADVEAELGEGELVSSMAIDGLPEQTVYQWLNPDGSNITLNFEDDVLAGKTQFGLE
jgi:hypothetical protein